MGAGAGRINRQIEMSLSRGELDDMQAEQRYRVVANLLRAVCKTSGGKIELSKDDLATKPYSLLIDSDGRGGLVISLEGYRVRRSKATH